MTSNVNPLADSFFDSSFLATSEDFEDKATCASDGALLGPDLSCDDDEDFDPFGLSAAVKPQKMDEKKEEKENQETEKKRHQERKIGTKNAQKVDGTKLKPPRAGDARADSKKNSDGIEGAKPLLPPRVDLKLCIAEEVSSFAKLDEEGLGLEGASEIFVKGTVSAHMTSSHALDKTSTPFVLNGVSESAEKPKMIKVNGVSTVSESDASRCIVTVPKTLSGFTEIASYIVKEPIDHMPLLLERKITRINKFVQVAIQVRTKLSNASDFKDFSVALALPTECLESSVEILTGVGVWEPMKRAIVWERKHLAKGESFMVSAQSKLENGVPPEASFHFPIMLKCSYQEPISSVRFEASAQKGAPASISLAKTSYVSRMVHRLN